MFNQRFWGVPDWDFRNPFAELERMRREMNRIVEGLSGQAQRPGAGVFPLVNVHETKDAFTVRAELPGMTSKEIEIHATGRGISISGERKIETEKDVRYHRRERDAGRFSRAVTLPLEINPDKVEAELVDGVLKLTLPKAEVVKPRQITVK